jgi:hypothetical protein
VRQVGRSGWPSRHDGNAIVSLVLAGAACAAAGVIGLWLWRAYPTTFWVAVAAAVAARVCVTAAGTSAGVRERDREARQHRADRTQERFLQHLRDGAEPGPGGVT